MNEQNNRPKNPAKPYSGAGKKDQKTAKPMVRAVSRGAAIRAHKRNQEDANRVISQYSDANQKTRKRANIIKDEFDKLKVTILGGLEDVGEKNMAVIEYQNQAIILDCGNNLGVDLPGVNYEINDVSYLETIKKKIRAYVITHGHLDHIGGLRHIVPKYPAPIFGSRFTIGMVEKTFDDETADKNFTPEMVTVNIDNHERVAIGEFFVEFIRVTHSIPDPTAVCIDSPVGRIIATGDFRLDPEPLDNLTTDIARLKELGDQGVMLLMSESSYSDSEGRTPTEHTLQKSFHDVITNASGRIFVAVFSSNMNRTQMIIDAAVAAGRKVALDGRSMLAYAEIAVRQGILKVPKGTIVSMQQAATIPGGKVLVMCTGGQGEPNAALSRMSEGDHKFINLNEGDTVIISSSPIPGNEVSYDAISNRLSRKNVHLFRHPTHELDGCGPLHVSGHARRDELREMINLVRPKYLMPVHGGALRRRYHAQLAVEEGVARDNIILAENGDSYYFSKDGVENGGQVPHGSLLVDQTGTIVSGIVVKDRIMMAQDGIVAVVLTIDRKSGVSLTSPDIISRGFIYMRDNEDLMNDLRNELRRAVQQRFKRVDLDRFKQEIKEHVTHFLFEKTQRSPIVIPVINIVGKSGAPNDSRKPRTGNDGTSSHDPRSEDAAAQAKRFAELRQQLLNQESRSN
jgi:ribonuclease J